MHAIGMQRTLVSTQRHEVVFCNGTIVVPRTLRKRLIDWYHTTPMHPGINRIEQTIKMHFTLPKLHDDFEKLCKSCKICQITKKTKIKYDKLPPKDAEARPWGTLCIDLIGPDIVKKRNKKEWKLHCLSTINPATGWFEIVEIPNKKVD